LEDDIDAIDGLPLGTHTLMYEVRGIFRQAHDDTPGQSGFNI